MKIFFTTEFINIVLDLLKSKNHKDIEIELISNLFNKSIDTIISGIDRLSGDGKNSLFIKKRIGHKHKGKSSGYRIYAWVIIKDNDLFIMYIHPKTGKYKKVNVSLEKKKELVKTYKQAKQNNEFIEVCLSENKIINCETKMQIFK